MITPKTDRTHAVTVAVDFEPTWLRWSMPDPRGDGTTLRQQAEHAHRLKDRMIRSIEAEGIRPLLPARRQDNHGQIDATDHKDLTAFI